MEGIFENFNIQHQNIAQIVHIIHDVSLSFCDANHLYKVISMKQKLQHLEDILLYDILYIDAKLARNWMKLGLIDNTK